MPGRGAAAAPTALKILEGVRASRINFNEPRPREKRPDCPAWLKGKAKYHFRKLVPMLEHMGILTEIDGDMLAAYCISFVELRDGYERGSFDKIEKALRQLRALAQEFGLTPSARSRLTVAPQSEDTGSLLD